MRIPRFAAAAATAALAVTALASPATADHSWGSYHWARTSNPFTLVVAEEAAARR